ncbi:MAG: hypothetical protein ACK52V_06495 [Betaproteobacteria bacterium]
MDANNITRWIAVLRLQSGKHVMREIKNAVPFTAAAQHAVDMAWAEMGEVVSLQKVQQ